MNLDGANIVVRPERAQSSANRAIAVGDLAWMTGNLNTDRAAVTSGFEHGVRSKEGLDLNRQLGIDATVA